MTDATAPQVFLGGSCNPTTWRKDIAIPALEAAGVTYYNPQVDDWSEELVAVEAAARDAARWLLFVIDDQTRAMASMIEALFKEKLRSQWPPSLAEFLAGDAPADVAGG